MSEIAKGITQALTAVGHVSWCWGLEVKGAKLVPHGLALVSLKQLTVKEGVEHTLPM